jgi:arabinose-5-phosphate isomerase
MHAAAPLHAPLSAFEQLRLAQDILRAEAAAIQTLAARLPAAFADAVRRIVDCRGAVIVSGVGKAGWIGQKISATLASTGTRSHFLHPSEAMHGDLGRVGAGDILLALSNSGESAEILQMLPPLRRLKVDVIALTATDRNSLSRAADIVLDYGTYPEACPLGVAPSTSTTLMLALGDALALVASRCRAFGLADFARYHPGGSLGQKLSIVDEIMRPIAQCRAARESETVRSIYVRLHGPGRRSGAILLVGDDGQLTGLFTDSDLARLLECQRDALFDQPIAGVMTRHPITVTAGARTLVAVETMACNNISELPVVDDRGRPLGLVDITDVISLLPHAPADTQCAT